MNITRRTAINSSAALLALPVVHAHAATKASPDLVELIDAHRMAFLENEHSLNVRDVADARYRKAPPPEILVEIAKGIRQELPSQSSPEEAKQSVRCEIDRYYDRRLQEIRRQNLSTALQAAAEREILAQKRAAYRNLVNATNKLAEAQEQFGLVSAEESVAKSCERLEEADVRLLAYPCRSMADLRQKVEYMTSASNGPGSLLYESLSDQSYLDVFLSALLISDEGV